MFQLVAFVLLSFATQSVFSAPTINTKTHDGKTIVWTLVQKDITGEWWRENQKGFTWKSPGRDRTGQVMKFTLRDALEYCDHDSVPTAADFKQLARYMGLKEEMTRNGTVYSGYTPQVFPGLQNHSYWTTSISAYYRLRFLFSGSAGQLYMEHKLSTNYDLSPVMCVRYPPYDPTETIH